ncbi:TetR family transcriptional regulator [Evansella sp. AB-P1]|uniref:TetR/AcrR family transcriptional regulator n=1 Tax=Evansella sp. AB-P1 TaxID=3037653 RepID=UPI00241E56B5|nr:TetR family transcriptional regulator [Evansella sp. AB-P1]MDG5789090.1 TetR family transcriptional regulator [Evansella sp. AB-P1]
MPPKKKFTEDQIIDAAFTIAKSTGMDSITIRRVAEQLGSSIAPIYVNFNDVEELKRAVIKKIVQLSQQLIDEQQSGSPFRDIGVASLMFAKKYPVLIRDFIMKPNEYYGEYDEEMGGNLVSLMKNDTMLQGLTDEELMMILLKMRAFQMGLQMMVANGLIPDEMDLDKMIAMSDSVAEDIVEGTRSRK